MPKNKHPLQQFLYQRWANVVTPVLIATILVGGWRVYGASEEQVRVTRVIDGDTIEVTLPPGGKEKVRIIGIDTPETKDPRKPVQCFGKEASKQMTKLVNGKTVVLERNPAEDRDKYKRLLRYISLNGEDIGASMIRDGFAFSYKKFPHPRLEAYNQLEKEAREDTKGLWKACDTKDMSKHSSLTSSQGSIKMLSPPAPALTTSANVDVYNFKGTGQKNLGTFTANAPWELILSWQNGVIVEKDTDPGIGIWFCENNEKIGICIFEIPTFRVSGTKSVHPTRRGTFEIDVRPDSQTSWTARIEIQKGTGSSASSQSQNSQQCTIKGNISSKKEKIYHLPGCGSYEKTVIDESAGERWFCSEQEAVEAGWRKARNC